MRGKKSDSRPKGELKPDGKLKGDLKDIVLIDTYKLALTRSQIDALAEILIKKKVMTYEEFWKLTNEKFKNANP